MSRYIDADAMMEELQKHADSLDEETVSDMSDMADGVRDAMALIYEAPSIDIVRCKECKHREEYPCKVYHDDDWFCADGEREGE